MSESQFEQELYEARRRTLQAIGALGEKAGLSYAEATYPNSYTVAAPGWRETEGPVVPWLKRMYDSADSLKTGEELDADRVEVSIAGRVMAIRVQGKAGFAQLQQSGQRIQIYVRKDDVGEDAFALYKLLDLGDHIGVKGYLMRTRTGELTVHVHANTGAQPLTFLAKAMLALPDKYHGLEDTELRYRQRYVDLFMNTGNAPKLAEGEAPGEPPINVRETFVKRAAVLRALRKFFDARGYLEVETPMLHTIAGGAAARPFKTHHNALDIPLSLRIAPELYLKRLVVGGLDRVYEINRNFRNEGVSTRHNPEFTMLEFYQAYSNYHDLMDLTQELVTFVSTEVNGTTKTEFNGAQIDLSKWTKLSMREAIIKFWSLALGARPSLENFASGEAFGKWLGDKRREPIENPMEMYAFPGMAPAQYLHEVEHALVTADADLSRGVPYGKTIAGIFEAIAEPFLIQPTIIYDFPLAVSPLSKVKPDEQEWVERFEFYIGGFEIGNAFSELNDPDDQRARFAAQLQERERGDDEAHAMDEDYVRALGYGLPPTAGEGIGIDRLTMVLTGAKSIRDVILFPLMRPQGTKAAE